MHFIMQELVNSSKSFAAVPTVDLMYNFCMSQLCQRHQTLTILKAKIRRLDYHPTSGLPSCYSVCGICHPQSQI